MAEKLTYLSATHLTPGSVLRDHEVKGLCLEAKASGKSWIYRHRVNGQRRAPKLGEFPTLGIDAAREAAKAMALEVAKGRDVSADRQAARAAVTMAELFELYAEHRTDKRSLDQDRRNWTVHLAPRVGRIKAEAFSLADADRALDAIAKPKFETVPLAVKIGSRTTRKLKRGGRVAANRCRALLSGLLKFAERDTVRARPRGSNFIMSDTRLHVERPRRRHVTREEFPRIWKALEDHATEYPRHVAALWASLYSGTRVSELLDARREWLSADGVLRLPVHKTVEKSGEDRIIRLPDQALALVSRLSADRGPRLFGDGLDRFSVGKVWRKVISAAGCPDVQPRDIRRSFASVARTAGLELGQVAHLLGHDGDEKTTAGYAYIWDDAARGMVQSVADTMDRIAKGDGK